MQERTYATPSPRSFACDLATLCAPTLAGLKPASLFRYQPAPGQDAAAMAAAWHTELSPRGVTVQVLKQCPRTGAVLVYVYRPARVAKLLADDRTLAFLAGEGYTPGTADELLAQLAELGFVVGETVTIVSEISGNLIIQVKEARIALDKTLAMRIIVG